MEKVKVTETEVKQCKRLFPEFSKEEAIEYVQNIKYEKMIADCILNILGSN